MGLKVQILIGLGSSILYSIRNWENGNQFVHWELYALIIFSIGAAMFQVVYLNKSLHHFSASIVTPVNYVFFSTATIVTSAVLFRGFNVTSVVNGFTIMLGFLVIVLGVALLFQYNLKLNRLAEAQRKESETVKSDNSSLNSDNLNEPHTDQNPITLWVQTFPLNPSLSRSNSLPQPLFLEKAKQPKKSTETTESSNVVLTGTALENGNDGGSISSAHTTNGDTRNP